MLFRALIVSLGYLWCGRGKFANIASIHDQKCPLLRTYFLIKTLIFNVTKHPLKPRCFLFLSLSRAYTFQTTHSKEHPTSPRLSQRKSSQSAIERSYSLESMFNFT